MSRTGLRAAVVSGAALLALAVGAEAAHACNLPKVSVSPLEVGPGDVVQYTISDTEAGAKWKLTVAGRGVAEGVSDGTAPRGTFAMPDLGGEALELKPMLEVVHNEESPTHDAGAPPWTSPTAVPVRYRPPAAAVEPAPEPPAPALPAPSKPAGALGVVEPPRKERPAGESLGSRPAPDRPSSAKPAPKGPAPVPSDVPTANQQVPYRPAVPARVEVRAADRSAVKAKPSRIEATHQIALPGPQPARRLPLVRAREVPVAAPSERDGLPGIVIVAVSCLVLLAAGGVAVWSLRGRGPSSGRAIATGGPQWVPPGSGLETRRDLVVEAELQEIVAEERARHVEREAAHIRSGPG